MNTIDQGFSCAASFECGNLVEIEGEFCEACKALALPYKTKDGKDGYEAIIDGEGEGYDGDVFRFTNHLRGLAAVLEGIEQAESGDVSCGLYTIAAWDAEQADEEAEEEARGGRCRFGGWGRAGCAGEDCSCCSVYHEHAADAHAERMGNY